MLLHLGKAGDGSLLPAHCRHAGCSSTGATPQQSTHHPTAPTTLTPPWSLWWVVCVCVLHHLLFLITLDFDHHALSRYAATFLCVSFLGVVTYWPEHQQHSDCYSLYFRPVRLNSGALSAIAAVQPVRLRGGVGRSRAHRTLTFEGPIRSQSLLLLTAHCAC